MNKIILKSLILTICIFCFGIGCGIIINNIIRDDEISELNAAYLLEIDNIKSQSKNLSNKIIILELQNVALNEIIDEYISETTITKEEFNQAETENQVTTSKNIWEIGESVPLPSLPTNIKSYTDYRVYNVEGTPHKRLQQAAWTDEHGCRRYNDDYIVALGSFYSTDIGDRFEVTLDTGRVFTIILGDGKADCDTDVTNMYAPCINYDGEMCANVIEFIIDKYVVDSEMYSYGSLDYHSEFKGNVIKMVYLGRDSSGDWSTYM